MDVLSDVLVAMRTGRPGAAHTSTHAPWGVRFHRGQAAGCHVVLAGACWFLSEGNEPVALHVGDVLFTPHGDGYALVDAPGSPTVDFEAAPAAPLDEMRIAGAGVVTELLCAHYLFDATRKHPLLTDLPGYIHIPAGGHPSLRAAVDLLITELAEPRAGTEAALPALIDMLLLYVLRSWLEDHDSGWASALRDPAISAALREIHHHPEKPWTVVDLAGVAGEGRHQIQGLMRTLNDRYFYESFRDPRPSCSPSASTSPTSSSPWLAPRNNFAE